MSITPAASCCASALSLWARPRVQVAPRGGYAGMPQSGLHQVNGRSPVQGVRSMGVPEPMGRNRKFDARTFGRLPDDAQNRQRAQAAAIFGLAGGKDRIVGSGLRTAQPVQRLRFTAGSTRLRSIIVP